MTAVPRAVSEVRRQLDDLAVVKAKANAYGTPDFASKMGLESILIHERELVDELRAAEMLASGSAAELVFDGDPVRDHTIQAAFLGRMLEKVQQLANALAQVLTSVPTPRAPLPRNIVAENRLMVAGWVPSSFAVRLRLPTKEELGQLYDPESQAVLDGLTEMLGGDIPSVQTSEWVSHARVKKHYYEFLEYISKQGASIRLRTRRDPLGVRVDARKARERVDWLDLLTVVEEAINLSGVLVGGNIESGRFELKVGDEIYRGYVSERAKARMLQITLGAEVNAKVRATRLVHEETTADSATSYFLDSIEIRQ